MCSGVSYGDGVDDCDGALVLVYWEIPIYIWLSPEDFVWFRSTFLLNLAVSTFHSFVLSATHYLFN